MDSANERIMARVVRINNILKHTNADSLELAIVDGWQVVVRKGEFKAGDLAIFCEIDSWVPHDLAPFLSKGKVPKVYNGVAGEKLRTIRLRGELSQGLLLNFSGTFGNGSLSALFTGKSITEGDDVTEILGIQKWEKPLPAELGGQVKGNFPRAFPKTDQPRIQNLGRQFQEWKEQGLLFDVQEKLEGSSMTCYLLDGKFGVCSRNYDLEETEGNTFWKVAHELDIESKMRNYFGDDANVAIQGELVGEGIQGNIYNIKGHTIKVFDIVFAEGMKYKNCADVEFDCIGMGLPYTPRLFKYLEISRFNDIKEILELAEGFSKLNPKQEREGVVFKCFQDPSITFKAISNKYLENSKD